MGDAADLLSPVACIQESYFTELPQCVRAARACAEAAHEGQFRKDKQTPYFTHPDMVARILWHTGVRDEAILAAAYVHDVAEDVETEKLQAALQRYEAETLPVQRNGHHPLQRCDAAAERFDTAQWERLWMLETAFGSKIAGYVAELTTEDLDDKVAKAQQQLEQAHSFSDAAKQIKIADQIASVITTFSEAPNWNGFDQYLRKAGQLCEACQGVNPLLDRLAGAALAHSRELWEQPHVKASLQEGGVSVVQFHLALLFQAAHAQREQEAIPGG